MLFNSIEFGFFLPVFFALYWLIGGNRPKSQNVLILLGSYIFYGWWDYRFLSLILLSTATDYAIGLALNRTTKSSKRSLLLGGSLLVNLGLLGFFKYFNFFAANFAEAFRFFGHQPDAFTLNVILPVGISFYTFQTLSYTIDVYRKRLEPTRDLLAFASFVAFFPQLVAGPIERASNLLPQFLRQRKFNYNDAVDGMRQILWGLFKKVVIADNCAQFANIIFNGSGEYSGFVLLLGALFFTFQIYGDFSGYSDIAIGTARLLGFDLMKNFAFPYFSRDIAEFWRRWHISLSTWFRDYLYIPLGGSRGNIRLKIRNVFIIFLVSGFWHGANWTFIIWGGLNALYFLPVMLTNRNRINLGHISANSFIPGLQESVQIFTTFLLTVLAWIFFRAENLDHAFNYIQDLFIGLFSKAGYIQTLDILYWQQAYITVFLVLVFMIMEWMGRHNEYALEKLWVKQPQVIRWTGYTAIFIMIVILGGTQQDFIYFQF